MNVCESITLIVLNFFITRLLTLCALSLLAVTHPSTYPTRHYSPHAVVLLDRNNIGHFPLFFVVSAAKLIGLKNASHLNSVVMSELSHWQRKT